MLWRIVIDTRLVMDRKMENQMSLSTLVFRDQTCGTSYAVLEGIGSNGPAKCFNFVSFIILSQTSWRVPHFSGKLRAVKYSLQDPHNQVQDLWWKLLLNMLSHQGHNLTDVATLLNIHWRNNILQIVVHELELLQKIQCNYEYHK